MISHFVTILVLLATCGKAVPPQEITIDLRKKGAEVASSMYGIFFEEINHAGDGGLYPELVQNRSFEEAEIPAGFHVAGDRLIPPPVKYHLTGEVQQIEDKLKWNTEPVRGWSLQTRNPAAASMALTKKRPRFETAPTNLEVTIRNASEEISLVNEGYWGMNIEAGANYKLRTIIRTSTDYKGTIRACLLSRDGGLLASCPVEISRPDEWVDFRMIMKPTAGDAKARLALLFDAPGTVWLDYVSLFPEATFKGRTNGLRTDVARLLVDMKPAFLRWPGGSIVGGITLATRFDWKKTLGDPAARSGEYFTWGYRCSYGFGYYEMLQFCEDIGADAMFVCSAGIGCQYRMGDACPDNEIDQFIDDCSAAIEYALGDKSTTWGARRAADGHPTPFPLKYVEIGNEHWGKEYVRRFPMFYRAIKKRYPQLSLIYNGLPGSDIKTDIADPHYYEPAESFYRSNGLFDAHSRGKYKIYVGEYACNVNVGAGNMGAALSEAAFIGGMERNGDLVTMTSYAPLLENEHDRRWSTNLIRLNSNQVIGRSSYYVQKMVSLNRPTYNVWSNFTQAKPEPQTIPSGGAGFGSINTSVEFRNIKISEKDRPPRDGPMAANVLIGTWKSDDGILSQTSTQGSARYLLRNFHSNNFVLECKARRLSGKEGFIFYYGTNSEGNAGYMLTIGGSGNMQTFVQRVENSATVTNRVPQTLEIGRWYDLKLCVTPTESTVYVDGKLLLVHKPETTPLQFLSSGYDEAAGELILKLVNGSGQAFSTVFRLEGAGEVERVGRVISLTAASENEENSFAEPKKIYPKETNYDGFGKKFDYVLPPFSYTILRIKTK